jgi:hypothetical protein
MKEVEVETVEKTELGVEDTPFFRELSDATDNPLDELGGFIVIGLRRSASLSVFSLTSLSLGVSSSTFLDFSTLSS